MSQDDKPADVPATNICPACGARFACGMAAGSGTCWCVEFPPLLSVPEAGAASCYCPACLAERVRQAKGTQG